LITDGSDISGLPTELQSGFAFKGVADIPLPALLALAVAAVLWYVLRYTRYGMRTLAIGSSRQSAERAGIRVRRHRISLAVLCGLLAGLAGFVSLADFASTTVAGHADDALGQPLLDARQSNGLGRSGITILRPCNMTNPLIRSRRPYPRQ
jgi:ribose transport system permease protein